MERKLASRLCGLVLSGAFVLSSNALAGQAPDNTRNNKADRSSTAVTADQAKNNMSDTELMRHIRKDVVGDKSLSTYGHNVKIIAEHGKVTLKGPVHTEDEKKSIEEYARKYAGDGNVTDDITVKGK